MGKKSKTKKPKVKIDNPYYCIGCNHSYTERAKDIGSPYIEDYCRYLGYCGIKCWDKLDDEEKHEISEIALFKGSTHKVRHKFYLKNIKGYK